MSLKPIIKSAREAIDRKDYPYALQLCSDALEFEPDNYWLLVFKAVALGGQGEIQKALNEYGKAVKSSSDNPIAFQGVVNLYENNSLELDERYFKALESLTGILFAQNEHEKHYVMIRKRINLLKKGKMMNEALQLLEWLSSSEAQNFYPSGLTSNPAAILQEQYDLLAPSEASQIAKEIETGRMRLNASDPLDRLIERVEVQNYSRELTDIIRKLSELNSKKYLPILVKRLLRIVLSDFCIDEDLRASYADEILKYAEKVDLPVLQCLKFNLDSDEQFNPESSIHTEISSGPKSVLNEMSEAQKAESFEKVLNLFDNYEKGLKKWKRAFSSLNTALLMKKAHLLKLEALIGLKYDEEAVEMIYENFSDQEIVSNDIIFEPILGVFERCQQVSQSVALLEAKLIDFDPEHPALILRLVDNLIILQRFAEAADYLNAVRQVFKNDLDARTEGHIAFASGLCAWYQDDRTKETLNHFLSAAKADPQTSKHFSWIGKFYLRIEDDVSRAKKCFIKSLQLDQSNENIRHQGQNNIQAAILYAECCLRDGSDCLDVLKSVSLDTSQSRNRRLFYYLGVAFFNLGNYLDAAVAFQSALKGSSHGLADYCEDSSDPSIEDENCLQWLGEAYLRSDRLGSAAKAFSRLSSITETCSNYGFIVAQSGSAAVHLKSDNPIEAVDCLDSLNILSLSGDVLIKISIDNAEAQLVLARFYLLQGRFISAMRATLKSLECSLKIISEHPEAGRLATAALLLSFEYREISEFPHEDLQILMTSLPDVTINSGLKEISDKIHEKDSLQCEAVKMALIALSVALRDSSINNLDRYWLNLADALKNFDSDFFLAALENISDRSDSAYHRLLAEHFSKQTCTFRRAQHHFICALKRNPHSSSLWSELGSFYAKAGDLEVATEAFQRALAEDSENLIAAFRLAQCSGTIEGTRDAWKIAKRAFSTQPVHFTKEFARFLVEFEASDESDEEIKNYAQIYLQRRFSQLVQNSQISIPSFETKFELLAYLNASKDPQIWSTAQAATFDCEFLLHRPENPVAQSGWRAVVEGLLPSSKERTNREKALLLNKIEK